MCRIGAKRIIAILKHASSVRGVVCCWLALRCGDGGSVGVVWWSGYVVTVMVCL